jgi:hypothetical protein
MIPTSTQFTFDGGMSREILENYLSRSLTMAHFLQEDGPFADSLRMLAQIRPKFLGRTFLHWGSESQLVADLTKARLLAKRIHALDEQIILQAGIFEIVTREVAQIDIPAWVFSGLEESVEERAFRYEDMLYPDGRYVDHWGGGASVPDITRAETQRWFYFLAGSYINLGIEALHFGQIMLIGRDDPDLRTWWEVLSRVRDYAKARARRHFVLCDAHVSSGVGCYGLPDDASLAPGGYRVGDRLLLDFHALPLRIKKIPGQPYQAELAVGHLDALYGRSIGGIAPSGWECEHLPYLVEFDNWGSSGHGGQSVGGKIGEIQGISDRYWVWGWDEICWYAHQSEAERNRWLWYAWRWLREHDENGFLEMPGQRGLADPLGDVHTYRANRPGPDCPQGFNQEDTIAAIWDTFPAHPTPSGAK